MNPFRYISLGFLLALAASLADAQVTESGKIHFYDYKELRGEETYQITQSANGELTVAARTELP